MIDWDTYCTDEPVCPHCKHKLHDAWDLGWGGGNETETECPACEVTFSVERDFSVYYITRPLREEKQP